MDLLYTAEATARGGREGEVVSDDGALDLMLAHPKEVGGPGGDTTNPEQLLAAAWSSCFHNALKRVAQHQKLDVSASSVTAKVSLMMADKQFALEATLIGHLPGLDKEAADGLMSRTHEVCPISKSIGSNIPVGLEVVL
ncbi:MAG TPA: organic hydroperoxide resistance protein [Mycobacteriales bacterium]|nr:organic hydroperoxide resistance protein [Mycobacteriales bacterium]